MPLTLPQLSSIRFSHVIETLAACLQEDIHWHKPKLFFEMSRDLRQAEAELARRITLGCADSCKRPYGEISKDG